jgi:pimeloyl-[acyl-carrier protein] methyl ester esterase
MTHHGPDFLLIPGWGATERVWDRFSTGFPEVRIFHGAWNDCVQEWPQAIERALERISGTCVLMGWSLGALLALRTALEFPERVDRLVLVSGTARMPEAEGYAGTDPRVLRAMRSRLTRDAGRVLSEFADLCAEPDGDAAVRSDYFEMAHTQSREALSAGLEALASLDFRGRLTEISVPVLLIHGSEDKVIPLSQTEALTAHLPDARLEVLVGRGHALPLTASGELVQAVRRFLA